MKGRAVIRATIDDAVGHIYTREEADAVIAGYPQHERDARAKGIPVLGSGRIYPLADADIEWEYRELPPHFVWVGGLDFGWTHPTAAVKCAWDREDDVFYVCSAYKKAESTPLIHAGALKPWGTWLPWAWPHDGEATEKGSGEKIRDQYSDHGLNMMSVRASFEDGSNKVEPGIYGMLDAMQTNRFKVATHLHDWWDEFRLYHRQSGRIVKEFDDLMDATRYAWMMRREAVRQGGNRLQKLEYNLKYIV